MYKYIDMITKIKIRKLEWLGHVNRIESNRIIKIVFDDRPGFKIPNKDGLRCTKRISNMLELVMGIKNWICKSALREVKWLWNRWRWQY